MKKLSTNRDKYSSLKAIVNIYSTSRWMYGYLLLIAYSYIGKKRFCEWKRRNASERVTVRDELSREKKEEGNGEYSSKRDEELPWWPSKAPIRHEGMRGYLFYHWLCHAEAATAEPKNTLPLRHAAHSSLNFGPFEFYRSGKYLQD